MITKTGKRSGDDVQCTKKFIDEIQNVYWQVSLANNNAFCKTDSISHVTTVAAEQSQLGII